MKSKICKSRDDQPFRDSIDCTKRFRLKSIADRSNVLFVNILLYSQFTRESAGGNMAERSIALLVQM